MLFCCSLPKFGKVPKCQSNTLHPKMSQIARNFSATFCATSATSLAQLLDFLSATFWGGGLPYICGRYKTHSGLRLDLLRSCEFVGLLVQLFIRSSCSLRFFAKYVSDFIKFCTDAQHHKSKKLLTLEGQGRSSRSKQPYLKSSNPNTCAVV